MAQRWQIETAKYMPRISAALDGLEPVHTVMKITCPDPARVSSSVSI
jgi:hypothetical protein